jgi:hypothetical protein
MPERRAHLQCPRCDWRFATRNAISQIEYCPRCLAQARRAVRLESGARAGQSGARASYRSPEDAAA